MIIRFLILLSWILFLIMGSCNNKKGVQQKQQLDSVISYYQNGKIDMCIDKAKKILEKDSSNDIVYQILGGAYLFQEKDSLAELYTKKAIFLNRNNSVALTNYGIILDKKENPIIAEVFYKKAIEANPKLAEAYSNYAANRLLCKDYKAAVVLGEKAISLADNIKDKGILCISYHEAGMYKQRDSLYIELQKLNYANLNELKELIYN